MLINVPSRREKVLGGHFAEALANLDACCAKYPDEPEFLFRRALVLLLQLGRTDEARDVLSQAEPFTLVGASWRYASRMLK